MFKTTIISAGILMLCLAALAGEIPKTINYQGLLTDSDTGEPVPDNFYMLTFTIYNSSSVPLWTSDGQSVEVINGRFNYLLGSSNPIPDSVFDEPGRWLGIKVEGDPEIVPRTTMTSSPYSYRAMEAYGLTADSASTDYLKVGGINESGLIRLYAYPSGQYVVYSGVNNHGGYMTFNRQDGGLAAHIGANTSESGILSLYRDGGAELGVLLSANRLGSGQPKAAIVGTGDSVVFDLSLDDDEAVILPFRSISDLEMFNEPGVGNDYNTSSTPVTLDESFTTICYKTMIFPDDGYVIVSATAGLGTYHTNGTISHFSFGVSTYGNTIPAGKEFDWYRPSSQPTGSIYDIITVQGYFEVSAGLYSFYFLGKRHSGYASSSVHEAQFNIMYFPTNYEFIIKGN